MTRPEPAIDTRTWLELVLVKAVHTIVFLVELGAIVWLVVTGWLGRRDRTVRLAALAVAAESVVFVANDGVCPLTPLAERLGAANGGVSDIFLPAPLARTIPIWSTTLIAVAVLLHVRAAIRDRWATPDRGGTRGDAGSG